MELRARIVAEGIAAGLHRSPYRGFSVEFSEYRQYSPGDDLRFLDWKAYAKTDREYIKIFEDETNLRCLIVFDTSRSMNFASATVSKIEYARTLAATLSHFLLKQRDIVGVARFDSEITDYLEARWRPGHFKRLLALLAREAKGEETNFKKTLESLSRICRKRHLIIIVSDFLSDPSGWKTQLGHLTAAGHDVRALQILDTAEVSLEFGKAAHWQDIESNDTLYIDPDLARTRYKEKFSGRQSEVRAAFNAFAVQHQTILTNEPMDLALIDFLSQPSRRRIR